jgi:hypothetical protein
MSRHSQGGDELGNALGSPGLGSSDSESVPMRERVPRAPLPARVEREQRDGQGMSHDDLVAALRAIRGLVHVGQDPANFHFRSRPFLHFHVHTEGTYADVRFGHGDFEPVWASTPQERQALLARVCDHVERLDRVRKSNRRGSRRNRRN